MRPRLQILTLPMMLLVLAAVYHAAPVANAVPASASALTNWQTAYSCFQTAGKSIARKEYRHAEIQLTGCSTNLPKPYDQMAHQFLMQLSAIFNRPTNDESDRLDSLADFCMALHAYPESAKLKAEAGMEPAPGEESNDELRAWRLLENGKTSEAIAEYQHRLQENRISTWQTYYNKQIDLAQRRPANLTNAPFAIEFVQEHYLKGFEGRADLFCSLKELNRVLPYAKGPQEALAVTRMIIQCLSSLNDTDGRDAWEDKVLHDFKSNQDACAEVYVNRGIRAYSKKDFPQAIASFQKVCVEYPNSEYYGDAQYDLGSTLQDQQEFDRAVEEFSKLFTSNVDDYKLVPGTSEDYKLYRHKAALRISECYESKKDYARALDYAQLAANQYKPLSWCHTCLKTAQEELDKRIKRLQESVKQAK